MHTTNKYIYTYISIDAQICVNLLCEIFVNLHLKYIVLKRTIYSSTYIIICINKSNAKIHLTIVSHVKMLL
jgi:hypothetical protein